MLVDASLIYVLKPLCDISPNHSCQSDLRLNKVVHHWSTLYTKLHTLVHSPHISGT